MISDHGGLHGRVALVKVEMMTDVSVEMIRPVIPGAGIDLYSTGTTFSTKTTKRTPGERQQGFREFQAAEASHSGL
jgi:hypothetical protein